MKKGGRDKGEFSVFFAPFIYKMRISVETH